MTPDKNNALPNSDDLDCNTSFNHPSIIKKPISFFSSPDASLVKSPQSSSSQVTGICHPSFLLDDEQHNVVVEPSSTWSFPYNDLEQELLEGTSSLNLNSRAFLPSCSRAKRSSSSSLSPLPKQRTLSASPSLFPENAVATLTNNANGSDGKTIESHDGNDGCDDDYSLATRQQLERSFISHFDLHTPSVHLDDSDNDHSIHHDNQHTLQRHMTDMMENRYLQMQETLSARIQTLEDKFQNTHSENHTSQSHSERGSHTINSENEVLDMLSTPTNDDDDDQISQSVNKTKQDTEQCQTLQMDQRLLELQRFVDRLENLVWNTPWISPSDHMSTAHVCERHREWSERLIRERQKRNLQDKSSYSHERLEATMERLTEWSNTVISHCYQ